MSEFAQMDEILQNEWIKVTIIVALLYIRVKYFSPSYATALTLIIVLNGSCLAVLSWF